jgi:hypothetical protein
MCTGAQNCKRFWLYLAQLDSPCREEVLAYAEAYRRVEQLRASRKARGWQWDDLDLPAPELDLVKPTLRVRHYMGKLNMYIMLDSAKRKRFDRAALTIQTAWVKCLDRRKMREMEVMVRVANPDQPCLPATTLVSCCDKVISTAIAESACTFQMCVQTCTCS